MEKIVVRAQAKVNLSLDVLGKREDGYHEMQMVNHSIELQDTLTFESCPKGVTLTSNVQGIPLDEKNLVMIALRKLQKRFDMDKGIKIYLEKRIPHEAGLAGGSSDAAATLKGLNALWNLGLSTEELINIGVTIGADVPYCLLGGTALVEGIGEKITPLSPMKKLYVVVVKPNMNISTPWAFKYLDAYAIKKRPDIPEVIRSLEAEDYIGLSHAMGNVFEPLVIGKYPEIDEIKNDLIHHGAIASIMTGSGPTVIGYYLNKALAENAWKLFSKKYTMCFLSETC
ncbi:4-(cytidine 5'-diphospho)-2-C-methyl-D-erythritol kinase [Acetobacterium sp.]|uniref:4-(cytidine 5'-diphospho)-2-C-methyl-D-erythritol kinase n=1 Tax=Acetobacterium sp. TaxID=1872094 RepID=UPI002F3EE40A